MERGYARPGRSGRAIVTAVPVVSGRHADAVSRPGPPLGPRRGHLTGFAVCWAACYLLPWGLLGRDRVRALLRQPARPLPSPRWLAVAALLVPPLGAIGTELAPQLCTADPAVAATAAGVAVVNAAGEELLWRGLFVTAFLEDPVWGWWWPAVGFTAWHLAPQAVLPSRRGSWPSHVATDASGLRVARFWLGRPT
jgi:membrane protease YdiL (CAAX protease family)